jgi:hypothetical protein
MPIMLKLTANGASSSYQLSTYQPYILSDRNDAGVDIQPVQLAPAPFKLLVLPYPGGARVRSLSGSQLNFGGRAPDDLVLLHGDRATIGGITVEVTVWDGGGAKRPRSAQCLHCFHVKHNLADDPLYSWAHWICADCMDQLGEVQDRLRRRFGWGRLDDLGPAKIDSYYLLAKIGDGGAGEVFAGIHEDNGVVAAVKVPRLPVGANPLDHGLRFEREQRIARSLRHPNIVRCYAVGGPPPFIASELVGGQNGREFAQDLARGGLPQTGGDWPIIKAIAVQLFNALAFLHLHNVVHRDVKPGNIMITSPLAGPLCVKLMDFGIAKIQDSVKSLTGHFLGTILYSSPEQLLASQDVAPHMDLYSAGMTIYALLTGRVAYDLRPNATDKEAVQAILADERTPLVRYRDDVPEPYASVIDRIVARDPSARKEEFTAEALARIFDG